MGFGGVFADVAEDVVEVHWAANEAVPVFLMPKGACGVASQVDLSCGAAFPGLEDFGKQLVLSGAEEDVNVVGHDHEGMKSVFFLVMG